MMSVLVLSGCSRKAEEVAVTAAPTTERVVVTTEAETEPAESEPESTERVAVDGMIRSYLTGEMVPVEQGDRRPLAVMISNDKAAMPHYDMNNAGVIYEAPVEGGINRYMAIIEDYDDLERIGSVRSCRTYYTYFAKEFEAVYAHFGQSVFALPYLENVDNINGIEGLGGRAFYRTSDKKAPHNAYTSGERVKKAMEEMGYDSAYPESYEGHFLFADKPNLLEDERDATYVAPGYPINAPWFEYRPDDGLYYRYQYGGPHNGDKGQFAVKNIIFQYCGWDYYNLTEYLDINEHTSERGYFFTNGKCQNITWRKDGEFGVTHYYDEDGQEIELNPGKTWICIIQSDRYDKAVFHGDNEDNE